MKRFWKISLSVLVVLCLLVWGQQPVSVTNSVVTTPPTETSYAPAYVTTAVEIKATAGTLDSYQVSDTGTATCFVEFFDSASPTLGTTAPIAVVGLFPTSSNSFEANSPASFHLPFSTALSVAAVTTFNGTTTCPASTALLNSVLYR